MLLARKAFQVGSVPYLNAAPLTRGLECQLKFATPAKLADLLRKGQLDAALVSISEVLLHDNYDILNGVAIASLGEVYSVFLAHRKPLDQMERVYCDPASLTSVNLMRVILAERGIHPELVRLESYDQAADKDFVLLIGDPAIAHRRAGCDQSILDLGTAWRELTGLPFVYAVWALRRGVENTDLKNALRRAKQLGLEQLEQIIASRADFDEAFRRDYFHRHIQYDLGEVEKCGVARFCELLARHQKLPVFAPRYVD